MLFVKSLEELKQDKEKLEQKIEKKQNFLDTHPFIPSKLKQITELKIEDLSKKLERINKKISTLEFEKHKKPANKQSKEYIEYMIKYERNEIDKIEAKKPSPVKVVEKIRELNKERHQANIKKWQIKLRDFERQEEKIIENSKKLESEKPEKLTNKIVNDIAILSNTNTNTNTNEFENIKGFKNTNNENTKFENNKTKKVSLLDITKEDLDNLSSLDLKNIDKLISIHKKILEKLTQIEKNMIDEQDTSIKKVSSSSNEPKIKLVSKLKDKKQDKQGILDWLLGGAVLTLFAKKIWNFIKPFVFKAIKSVKDYFSKKLESVVGFFKDKIDSILNFLKNSKIGKFFGNITNKISNLWESGKQGVANILGFNKTKTNLLENTNAETVKSSNTIDNLSKNKKVSKITEAKKTSSFWGTIKNTAKSAWDKAKTIGSKVTKVIENNKLIQIAKNSITGIIQFGKEKIYKYGGKILELAKKKVLPIIEKIGIKSVGKKAFQQFLNKIPGLGILSGLGFGVYDLIRGKYKKAAIDILAGVIPTVMDVASALSGPFAPLIIAAGLGASTALTGYGETLDNIPTQIISPKKIDNTQTSNINKSNFKTKIDNTQKIKTSDILNSSKKSDIQQKAEAFLKAKKDLEDFKSKHPLTDKNSKIIINEFGEIKKVYKDENIEKQYKKLLEQYNKVKNINVEYKYNKNQPFKLTNDDLINKAEKIKKGDKNKFNYQYTPKNENHKNSLNNETLNKVKAEPVKNKRAALKEKQVQNITNLSTVKQVQVIQQPQENILVNKSISPQDNGVRVAETFKGLNDF